MGPGAVDRVFARSTSPHPASPSRNRDEPPQQAARGRRAGPGRGRGRAAGHVGDGQVEQAELHIYEPPRFFEAFLRGRAYTEPPDITSRICGICPVAYQTSACNAIEDACGAELDPPLAELRRLLYCGEWISSHALHIYLLHAPDFLGYPDAIALARDHRDIVERGLRAEKGRQRGARVVGGRAIHPVNMRVGGFYRVPSPGELPRWPNSCAARWTRRWTRSGGWPRSTSPTWNSTTTCSPCTIPAGTRSSAAPLATQRAGLHRPASFPATSPSSRSRTPPRCTPPWTGTATSPGRWPGTRSTPARCPRPPARPRPRPGLARSAATRSAASSSARSRSSTPSRRRCGSSTATSARTVPRWRCRRARAPGTGSARHPRGLLYHRYELDADGLIRSATIIPPTSQNQAAIEDDLRRVITANLDLDDASLTALCERAIRNHDPCISCAAHFLTLSVRRR